MAESQPDDPLNYVFRIAPPSDAPPPPKVLYVKKADGKMEPHFYEDEPETDESSASNP